MEPSPERCSPSDMAVQAVADLSYERMGERTILARCAAAAPLRVPPPIALGACAYTTLLNMSGGLVAGDELDHRLVLGPRTHVLVTTPGAAKVYRSTGAAARSRTVAAVGPESVLEWVPDPTVFYAGSKLVQRLRVDVAAGGTVLISDLWIAGRIACGEEWAHAELDLALAIDLGRRPLVRERVFLGPDRAAALRGWPYRGAWYAVADRCYPWSVLAEEVAHALDDEAPEVYAGCSPLTRHGVVVSLVSRTAPAFLRANALIWSRLRAALLREVPPELRKH